MIGVRSVAAAVLASVLAVGSASAQVTIGTIGEPSSGTTFPFGYAVGYTKFQQIYSASLFSSPLSIGSISFYSNPGTQVMQAGTYTFSFSQTSVAPGGITTGNPAANETGPRQAFGSVTVAARTDAPSIFTVLGSTYNYNPSGGNLVLNIDFVNSQGFTFDPRASFDRYTNPQGQVLVAATSDRQFQGTTGATNNIPLVTTFGPSTTVPEPSTYVLMAVGLAGLAFVSRRRTIA